MPIQGVVLRAMTSDCGPIYGKCRCGMGVAYRITPYTTKKSHSSWWIFANTTKKSRSHGGFLRRSQGHQQFSSKVTRSQVVVIISATCTSHIMKVLLLYLYKHCVIWKV